MDGGFELPESPPGDGGGVSSDESTTAGSIMIGKNNQHTVTSSEVSSPFPVVYEGNLDLGLGLSIGGGDEHATSKYFPPSLSNPNFFSIDSSSSVVGWPPIRRGHRLANQTKSPAEQSSTNLKNDECFDVKKVFLNNGYLPVKVNMDGTRIGRKVDLSVHDSYETLARTVEDMFFEKGSSTESGRSKLLDATSEFVLTYEDKDGDRMLLGDVPWQMFLIFVKRLRIMRNSETNKRAMVSSSTFQEKKIRRSNDSM